MRDLLQSVAMKVTDGLAAVIPQPVPEQRALRSCKIISHRGEHDNVLVFENTLAAFEQARANGVWGVECDIRWTADLVPVINHDANGSRLFENPVQICDVSFTELRAQLPLVPSLAELVAEFGGNTHLMLEIKAEHYPEPERQKAILEQQLAQLSAGEDYHFLALDTELFSKVDFVAPGCCFPVSEINASSLSEAALEAHCGGLMGHFYLLTNNLKARHERAGQRVGTGFISSRNCLFRELNREVEWLFSNDAVKIQKIRDQHLQL